VQTNAATHARTIALLGGTGSIGQSVLKVLRLHPDKYQLYGVSAHHNIADLAAICIEFQPSVAIVADAAGAKALRAALGGALATLEIAIGAQALCSLAQAPEVDTVVAAIVGAAGLPSTLAAANAGKRLLLANKESLVVGGALVSTTRCFSACQRRAH
jgi:1-deoxy-D-xylulose-5-phosphate reductoisomerase